MYSCALWALRSLFYFLPFILSELAERTSCPFRCARLTSCQARSGLFCFPRSNASQASHGGTHEFPPAEEERQTPRVKCRLPSPFFDCSLSLFVVTCSFVCVGSVGTPHPVHSSDFCLFVYGKLYRVAGFMPIFCVWRTLRLLHFRFISALGVGFACWVGEFRRAHTCGEAQSLG